MNHNVNLQLPNNSLPSHQIGASVTGVMFGVITVVVFIKLGLAIIPAQVGDYQLTKALATELKKANDNKETKKQYLDSIQRQLKINGTYDTKAEDVVTFTSEIPGNLKIKKDYTVVNNFFGNVDIVNRFQGEITPADSF